MQQHHEAQPRPPACAARIGRHAITELAQRHATARAALAASPDRTDAALQPLIDASGAAWAALLRMRPRSLDDSATIMRAALEGAGGDGGLITSADAKAALWRVLAALERAAGREVAAAEGEPAPCGQRPVAARRHVLPLVRELRHVTRCAEALERPGVLAFDAENTRLMDGADALMAAILLTRAVSLAEGVHQLVAAFDHLNRVTVSADIEGDFHRWLVLAESGIKSVLNVAMRAAGLTPADLVCDFGIEPRPSEPTTTAGRAAA